MKQFYARTRQTGYNINKDNSRQYYLDSFQRDTNFNEDLLD